MYTTRILTLLICLCCCIGCQETTQPAGSKSKVVDREDDQRYARLASGALDDGDKAAEAKAWLDAKNTTNVLWKTSRAQTLQFVNDLYQAGAVKVYAIYAPRDGTVPVNLCAELFLELPIDTERTRPNAS